MRSCMGAVDFKEPKPLGSQLLLPPVPEYDAAVSTLLRTGEIRCARCPSVFRSRPAQLPFPVSHLLSAMASASFCGTRSAVSAPFGTSLPRRSGTMRASFRSPRMTATWNAGSDASAGPADVPGLLGDGAGMAGNRLDGAAGGAPERGVRAISGLETVNGPVVEGRWDSGVGGGAVAPPATGTPSTSVGLDGVGAGCAPVLSVSCVSSEGSPGPRTSCVGSSSTSAAAWAGRTRGFFPVCEARRAPRLGVRVRPGRGAVAPAG